MKNLFLGLSLTLGAFSLMAEIPAGYYSTLEGKSGAALKQAVKAVCRPADFITPAYGSGEDGTWTAFENTDVRVVNGQKIWWDMYSNRIVYVSTGHDAFNIEHSVPNSWWGAKAGCLEAYQDLMHLNPSDADTNNKKSSLPLGVVADVRLYDNGVSKIGTPVSGYGGGSSSVFEPADEYKGDFARAYLYVFTMYSDVNWLAEKGATQMLSIGTGDAEPLPWVVDMLLSWAAADPVDDKELNRNDEIYKIQHNRNPYIDYPELVTYVFGDNKNKNFSCTGKEAVAVNRPAAPEVSDMWLTAVNTYYGRWWEAMDLKFMAPDGDLWVSVDGGAYQRYGDSVQIPAATSGTQTHEVKAYTVADVSGMELRSAVTTISLMAKDPAVTDYAEACWVPVTENSQIDTDSYYIILSENVKHVMSYTGGTSSQSYMSDGGFVRFRGNVVDELPAGAAVVRFVKSTTGIEKEYQLQILDTKLTSKGYWLRGSKNTMKLNPAGGSVLTAEIGGNGEAVLKFNATTEGESGQPFSVQFNKTQQRFNNYATKQGAVLLYKFDGFYDAPSGVVELPEGEEDTPIAVEGRNIYAGDGGAVYTLDGRRVSGLDLAPGIYVAVTRGGKAVKISIR